MSNYFERLAAEAFRAGVTPRTKESLAWFRRRSHKMNSLNRESLLMEKPLIRTKNEIVGTMNFFWYDPKHKDTLPYYDRFPLIIVVGPATDGFYGINMHYLPPLLRAKLFDGLMRITNNKRFDETTRFKATYGFLKGMKSLRYFKPAFKHYLTAHVRSQFSTVSATEWEIAIMLPVADFKKSSRSNVYRDSRKNI